ncbi:sterol uptake control protein 2 [Aspergillus udagawae]|uniref:Sterol uptake control protein 2 n=1 Tax=Aspergillus udagawae TaxID=91492 RepID=A0A8H3NJE1_9EURO|nr:sterol uptake control protein 2 [Aspergillus udagawae]
MPFARLRFGPVISSSEHAPPEAALERFFAESRSNARSKFGCQQLETPWFSLKCDTIVNRRLLQYWLERVSQMLVIDPEDNPYSFPALEYILQSPALIHTIQSLSANHEQYFPTLAPIVALEERGKALACLRKEVDQNQRPPQAFLLTVMLMALAHGADCNMNDYGKQHLIAARIMINRMLQNTSSLTDDEPLARLCLGMYLYWDMCTAFLLDSDEERRINSLNMSIAIHRMGNWHHPMYGPCTELLFILGNVGRYCRRILDSQQRNFAQEAMLEQQLCCWKVCPPNIGLGHLYEALRKHGLIFLYRASGQNDQFTNPDLMLRSRDSLIKDYAEETVRHLMQIPATSNYLNFQSLPLLAAGSELPGSRNLLRAQVRERLRAVYSLNRLPANLHTLQLLEELWNARDNGNPSFWLYHMLQKNWRLLLG